MSIIQKLLKIFCPNKPYIITLLFVFVFILDIYHDKPKNIKISKKPKDIVYFDQYETFKYNEIKDKLLEIKCSEMWDNQREFLNGIIRKFRPVKILEIGVSHGGSSIIILNAIDDIIGAQLYSIDLNSEQEVGECVPKYFPKLSAKWNLFKGNIASEVIEKIGNNIDMVFIDTAHFEPGEILDFLIVLPFLKEEAIVIFHDIANQITRSPTRNEWAPYIIFNNIRGEKYYPSGDNILTQDIGAIILEKNQYKYYHDYFRLLGGQWQYYPKELHISQLKNFFKKYYDTICLKMFEETITFNKNFVKQNPKPIIYHYNSD